MKNDEVKRYKFDFEYNNVNFDVIFFTDENPFILLFGAVGSGLCFEVNVNPGYNIDLMLSKDKYNILKKILHIPHGNTEIFRTKDFFNKFYLEIPKYNKRNSNVKPSDIAPYKKDIIDESEKIYFLGWRDNDLTNEKVSDRNIEKTRLLIGNYEAELCKRKNISSRWTNDRRKERIISRIEKI